MVKLIKHLASLSCMFAVLFLSLFGCGNFNTFQDGLYAGMREGVDGMKVAYNVSYDDAGAYSDTNTGADRDAYFNDIYKQMEFLSELLLNNLAGEYGRGVEAGTQVTLTNSPNYGPYEFAAGLIPMEVNTEIFDTNNGAIDAPVTGAVVEGNAGGYYFVPLLRDDLHWLLDAQWFSYDSAAPESETEQYREYYVEFYKRFLITRLFEIVLNKDATDFNTISILSTPDWNAQYINKYIAQTEYLGFTAEDVSQIKDLILNEFIGEQVLEFDALRPKNYSEPYIPWSDFSGTEYMDLLNGSVLLDNVAQTIFMDLNGNGIWDSEFNEDVQAPLYYRDYVNKIDALVDMCANLEINSKRVFVHVLRLEVRDLTPMEAIRPGATDVNNKRTRFVMESQEYRSAIYMFKGAYYTAAYLLFLDPDVNISIDVSIRLVMCPLAHVHTGTCVSIVRSEHYVGRFDTQTNAAEEADTNYAAINLGEIPGMEYVENTPLSSAFNNKAPAPGRGWHTNAGNTTFAMDYVRVPSVSGTGTSIVYNNFGTSYVEFVFDVIKDPDRVNANYKFRFQIWPLAGD